MVLKNVKKESELYPEMCNWLTGYLKDKYKNKKCKIIVEDCHSMYLDSILNKYHVINYFPQIVGLKIEIDVLGIVIFPNDAYIYIIEAKKTPLNLQNLGQLLVYSKLCNPEEAFLLSSAGVGSLDKVLVNLSREDLLDYGSKKLIRKIKVAKWDITKKSIDYITMIPKI